MSSNYKLWHNMKRAKQNESRRRATRDWRGRPWKNRALLAPVKPVVATALLLLCGCVATPVPAATITGDTESIVGVAVQTNLTFRPLNKPVLLSGVLVLTDPKTITNNADGTFSIELRPGDYELQIGANQRNRILLTVPSTNGSYTLNSLVTTGAQYPYEFLRNTNLNDIANAADAVWSTPFASGDVIWWNTNSLRWTNGPISGVPGYSGGGGGGSVTGAFTLNEGYGMLISTNGTTNTAAVNTNVMADRAWVSANYNPLNSFGGTPAFSGSIQAEGGEINFYNGSANPDSIVMSIGYQTFFIGQPGDPNTLPLLLVDPATDQHPVNLGYLNAQLAGKVDEQGGVATNLNISGWVIVPSAVSNEHPVRLEQLIVVSNKITNAVVLQGANVTVTDGVTNGVRFFVVDGPSGTGGTAPTNRPGTGMSITTNNSFDHTFAVETNTIATRAWASAQDTVVSNGVTTAFGAADTVVSNALAAANTATSNRLGSYVLATNGTASNLVVAGWLSIPVGVSNPHAATVGQLITVSNLIHGKLDIGGGNADAVFAIHNMGWNSGDNTVTLSGGATFNLFGSAGIIFDNTIDPVHRIADNGNGFYFSDDVSPKMYYTGRQIYFTNAAPRSATAPTHAQDLVRLGDILNGKRETWIVYASGATNSATVGTNLVMIVPFNCSIETNNAMLSFNRHIVGTGSQTRLEILTNGVSIMSTPFHIDASETNSLTAATNFVFSTTNLLRGSYLEVKTLQVGATIPGSGLHLVLPIRETP